MYCLEDQEPAGWRAARLFEGAALKPGACFDGPAIVAERNATVVVEPGWQARCSAAGHLELRRVHARPQAAAARCRAGPGGCDPVMLEVFNNLFMNVAEQMGLRLQNTAHSVNIKERLDFSCAVFDAVRVADRERAAHAGALGFDERLDPHGHAAQPGAASRARSTC